jgi:hypothetical protein
VQTAGGGRIKPLPFFRFFKSSDRAHCTTPYRQLVAG